MIPTKEIYPRVLAIIYDVINNSAAVDLPASRYVYVPDDEIHTIQFNGEDITLCTYHFEPIEENSKYPASCEVAKLLAKLQQTYKQSERDFGYVNEASIVSVGIADFSERRLLHVQTVFNDGKKNTEKYIKKCHRDAKLWQSDNILICLRDGLIYYSDIVKNAFEKAIKTKSGKIMLSGAIALTLIIIFAEQLKQLLILSLVAGYGLYSIYEKYQENKLQNTIHDMTPEQYYDICAREYLTETIAQFCNSDPRYSKIKSDLDISDSTQFFDGNCFLYYIQKSDASTIDVESLKMLAYKIEHRIRLKMANPMNCKFPVYDNIAPEIAVTKIEDIGATLRLSVFIANNPERRYWLALYSQNEKRTQNTTKIDANDEEF